MVTKRPEHLGRYFWDHDASQLSWDRSRHTIEGCDVPGNRTSVASVCMVLLKARRALGVSLGSAPPLASLTRNALGQENLEQALVGDISLVCEGLELLQECLR